MWYVKDKKKIILLPIILLQMILPIYGRELIGTTAFTMRVTFFTYSRPVKKNSRLRIFFVPTTNAGFRKVTLSFVNARRKKVADRKKYLTDEFTVG